MFYTMNEMVLRMEEIGYYYDDIDSYEGWLCFTIPSTGGRISFSSLENLIEWYEEVCD